MLTAPDQPERYSFLCAVVLCTTALAGCAEFPDAEYATERVEIATAFDARLCAGTAAKIEGWAVDASQRLGIDPLTEDPVLLVWGDAAVREYCREGVKGCYLHEPRVVAASYSAIAHELVHATTSRSRDDELNTFVEEGIAEAMTASALRREMDPMLPSILVSLPRGEFEVAGNRATAGHFFRYLSQTYAFAVLDELRSELKRPVSIETADDVFAEVLGVRLTDLEQSWLSDSPSIYTRLPDTTPDADAVLSESVALGYTLACDDPRTEGPLAARETESGDPTSGMSSARVLDVVRAAEFEIHARTTSTAEGGVVLRSLACWDGSLRNVVHEVAFGLPSVVALEACRWEVLAWTPEYVGTEVEVTIERL